MHARLHACVVAGLGKLHAGFHACVVVGLVLVPTGCVGTQQVGAGGCKDIVGPEGPWPKPKGARADEIVVIIIVMLHGSPQCGGQFVSNSFQFVSGALRPRGSSQCIRGQRAPTPQVELRSWGWSLPQLVKE